jgi:hypothetical protein
MTSPKSVELKLGAKEPSTEEAKRCELQLPMEIKRTAHICCRGCASNGAIASCYTVKEEKVPTPIEGRRASEARRGRITRRCRPSLKTIGE